MKTIPAKYYLDERGYNKVIKPKVETARIISSYSTPGVVRGLHLQYVTTRIVHVLFGHIRDYVYNDETGDCYIQDMYPESPSLSLPPPFAHGFMALSPSVVLYEFDTSYNAEQEVIYNIMWHSLPFIADMEEMTARYNLSCGYPWNRSSQDKVGGVPPVPGILRL